MAGLFLYRAIPVLGSSP